VDIEIQAKEIIRYRELLNELIAKHTGQPLEKVTKDTDRDFILTAEQAVEYGAVDEVITSRKILEGHRNSDHARDLPIHESVLV
jgi:ATP-dependent Clp protease protease subunit